MTLIKWKAVLLIGCLLASANYLFAFDEVLGTNGTTKIATVPEFVMVAGAGVLMLVAAHLVRRQLPGAKAGLKSSFLRQ